MKLINKLAVSAVLALSSASVAAAAVITVHVTGSTAFRAADVTAETAFLASLGSGQKAVYWDSSDKHLTHANYSIIYGPVVGGTQYVFENLFNGSIGGTESLITPSNQPFPSATNSTYSTEATAVVVGSSAGASTGGFYAGSTVPDPTVPADVDNKAADIAFSDVFFNTCTTVIALSTNHPTLGTPSDSVVGVVPFVFVGNQTSPTGLNMTPQIFENLWANGTIALSQFTGSATDASKTVYAFGRDVDSGTRASALLETAYSGGVAQPVAQYFGFDSQGDDNTDQATVNGSTGVVGLDSHLATGTAIAVLDFVPEQNVDGIDMSTGDGGFNQGSNLATAMESPLNSSLAGSSLVTYLGVSDAVSALAAQTAPLASAHLMSYNGFTFDPRTTASDPLIQYGQYTYWSYEHEFTFGSLTATSGVGFAAAKLQTFLAGSANQIDTLASDGITLTSMKVGRTGDGGNVAPPNPYAGL